MSTEPRGEEDGQVGDADMQADAMRVQLRKDVASWSKARSESSLRDGGESGAPASVPARRTPKAAAKTGNAKPAAPLATPPIATPHVTTPAVARTKPYSMSYDGRTTAEYIQEMIDRGAR